MHDNYNSHRVWRFKRTYRYFTDNESYVNMDKIRVVGDWTCDKTSNSWNTGGIALHTFSDGVVSQLFTLLITDGWAYIRTQ